MTPISNYKHSSRWVFGLLLVVVAMLALRVGMPIYRYRQALNYLKSNGCVVFLKHPAPGDWWPKPFFEKLYLQCTPAAVMFVRVDSEISYSEIPYLLSVLGTFSELRVLDCASVPLDDGDLKSLKNCKKLHSLNLTNTHVTDAGLMHLEQLTELHTLNLAGTTICDAGLIAVQRLENLYGLNLDSTRVTNAGLLHLKSLKNLRTLEISNTSVTEDGVSKLHDLLPNLDVSDD